MTTPARLTFTTALLACLVLFGCGGGGSSSPSTSQTASQANTTTTPTQSVVLTVRHIGSLPAPVQLPATTGFGHELLAMGGLDSADGSVSNIVRVRGSAASVAGQLPTAFHDAAATAVGGHVYVFGGGDAGATRAQILEVIGSGTRQVGSLPSGSSDCEAVTISNTAYVVGGYDGTNGLTNIVAYRPGSSPHVVGHLPLPLRYASVVAIDGRVLVAGGTSGTTPSAGIFAFDPKTSKTTRIGSLPKPITHAAGAELNGLFYVIGGRSSSTTSQVGTITAIDPTSGVASPAGRLSVGLSDMGAFGFGNRIIAVGGKDSAGVVKSGILELRP
ncbi:MAG: kelch repeat-containing protein [Actinomycetes bacterium]